MNYLTNHYRIRCLIFTTVLIPFFFLLTGGGIFVFSGNLGVYCQGGGILFGYEPAENAEKIIQGRLRGLSAALDDPDPLVQAMAWREMGYIFTKDGKDFKRNYGGFLPVLKKKAAAQASEISLLLKSADDDEVKTAKCAIRAMAVITGDKSIKKHLYGMLRERLQSDTEKYPMINVIEPLAYVGLETRDREVLNYCRKSLVKNGEINDEYLVALGIMGEEMKDPSLEKILGESLLKDNHSVRSRALPSLNRLIAGSVDPATLENIASVLESQNANDRINAVNALRMIGEKTGSVRSADYISGMLQDYNDIVRNLSAYSLVELSQVVSDESFIEKIVSALNNGRRTDVQRAALTALEGILKKRKDFSIVSAVIDIVKNNKYHWRIRSHAISVLGAAGGAGDSSLVIKEILTNCRSENPDIRSSAIRSLANFTNEKNSNEIVKLIIYFLDDKAWIVRFEAARALGKIGRERNNTKTVDTLIKAAENKKSDSNTLCACMLSLGETGEKFPREKIEKTLGKLAANGDIDWKVRSSAIYGLGMVYGKSQNKTEILEKLTKSLEYDGSAGTTLEVIGKITGEDKNVKIITAMWAVTKYLRHNNPNIRKEAIATLGKLITRSGNEKYVSLLIECLGDREEDVRNEAFSVLKSLPRLNQDFTSKVLNDKYTKKTGVPRLRFIAYCMKGGNKKINRMIAAFGI